MNVSCTQSLEVGSLRETRYGSKKDWAEFVPAMRGKVVRFEVVDEEEWEQRLNAMLAA